jgi:hypothetical protein
VPAQRRRNLEVWNGAGWALYLDVDSVLRHGRRLSELQAVALLYQTRDGASGQLSDEEALIALRDRMRRA